MSASFDSFQVLYSDGAPASFIRLGQLLVDESEVNPLDMLKICTDDSPLTYTSISDGVIASILGSNNVWTGTNEFDAAVNFDAAVDFDSTANFDGAVTFTSTVTVTGAGPVLLGADNLELRFGAGGDDLAIFHNGSNNVIESNTGSLLLTNTSGTVVTIGQDSTVTIPQGAPSLKVGSALCGVGSSASTILSLYINSSSAAVEQLRIAGGGCRITGTSDATQPSSRYGLYTTDFATERGYLGFPTTSSDTMILRNIAGSSIQLRASTNNIVIEAGTDFAEFAYAVVESGVITPTALSAATDNWNPTSIGEASIIRAEATGASRNLTGIVAQNNGTRILLCNIGTQNIVLVHDATSTAANRFLCPGSANYTLNTNDAVYIWYDTVSDRWRVVAEAT